MTIIKWVADALRRFGQSFAEPDKPSTPVQRAYDAGYEGGMLDERNPYHKESDRYSAWEAGRRERIWLEDRLW